MSGAVDVSVVIPCYNHGSFLQEAVRSADASRGVRFEVIVVDDGSSDGRTLEVMAGLRRDGYQVVRHDTNQGVSAARNSGIALARGRYILPLDADNHIRPDYLRLGAAALDRAPRVGVAYGDLEFFGEGSGRRVGTEFALQHLLLGNIVDNCAVFRRAIWEACGGYDAEMPDRLGYEDWEFWLQVAKRGWEFLRIAEVMVDYRVRSDSMVRACVIPENHSRLVRYLATKHRDLYEAYLPEVVAGQALLTAQESEERGRCQEELARIRAEREQLAATGPSVQEELGRVRAERDHLAARARALQATLVNMRGSAFWRARGAYVRLRRLIDQRWS